MDYEFHVGDYVKTWDGVSGYISNFKKWRSPAFIEDSVWFVYTTEKGNSYHFESEVSQLKYEFQRIGAYDFTKKEKKEIEPLNYNASVDATIKQLSALKNKINELVDVVNKLRSDYDEHIEAHRQTDR